MMMLDERLFDQEWIQELPADARWLFLYLLAKSSRKTGIFELNMRMINFGAATEKKYTKEDVLTMYGSRIQLVPGKDSTAIIVDYVATNWAKSGKPIDSVRNPLFKSVVQELERYGMSIDILNSMAKHKITLKEECDYADKSIGRSCESHGKARSEASNERERKSNAESSEQLARRRELFGRFWDAYPRRCPRRVDKRKCEQKFLKILSGSKNEEKTFDIIMQGLARWDKTEDWTKDNGRYICAPLVWLNNERWEADVKEGGSNGNRFKQTANNNIIADASGIF